MKKNLAINITLVTFIVLEYLFLFVFYQNQILHQTLNSFGYFTSSFSIGIVLLVKFYNQPKLETNLTQPSLLKKYGMYAFYGLCFVYLNIITIDIYKAYDFGKISDIIPSIIVLAKRFLAGQYPYTNDALAAYGYHAPSSYLPMHWLPGSIAEYFHFDYRTMSFVVWCIGAFVILARSLQCKPLLMQILFPLMLSGAYLYLAMTDPTILGVTVEIMICGYYMLLMFGLNQNNTIITGFLISICLLSRYYVVLWLPLWAFVLFVSGERKQLYKTILAVIFFLLIIYIIPFLSKDWTSFYRSYKNNYEMVPFYEWHNMNPEGKPFHLFSGVGIAHIFYRVYLNTDLFAGYLLLKKLFFYIILFVLSVLGFWYWRHKKNIHYRIFLLASFKIYLSFFLTCLVLPYRYLAITSVFVTLAIFAEQARYKVKDTTKEEDKQLN